MLMTMLTKEENKNVNICMTSGLQRGKVAEMKLSSTKVKNVIFELPRRKYTKIRIQLNKLCQISHIVRFFAFLSIYESIHAIQRKAE